MKDLESEIRQAARDADRCKQHLLECFEVEVPMDPIERISQAEKQALAQHQYAMAKRKLDQLVHGIPRAGK